MTADDNWNRIKDVLAQALETPPPDRDAWLDHACSEDPELRTEVDSLLRSFDDAGAERLDRPAALPLDAEAPPARVGPFVLGDVIGMGGMGIVYRARQDRPQRDVALKLVRPGVASAAVLRRFEHEAELVGRLEHPGIATVYEVGTTGDGAARQPYFAMELVDGPTLAEHLDSGSLDVPEALELLAAAADAVQHAHAKGVIHRDLKPANFLLGADGPKIVDFGVARLTTGGDGMATRQGEVLGTLAYMSPEQASDDRNAVDTRTDVYALGAILHETLTGVPPHDLSELTIAAAIRVIREQEPPPLRARGVRVARDLETIVAKALANDPGRRYSTAAALAEDIRRFLGHQPISARPASALYQLGRFARRNRALVAGAALTVLALIGGLVLFAWQRGIAEDRAVQAEEARKHEKAARLEAERSSEAREAVIQYFVDLFLQAEPGESGYDNAELLQIIQRASETTAVRLADMPFALASLHVSLAKTHRNLRDRARAAHHAEAAVAVLDAVQNPDRSLELLYAHASLEYAESVPDRQDVEAVMEAMTDSLELFSDHGDVDGQVKVMSEIGWYLHNSGRRDQGLAWHRRAVALSRDERSGQKVVHGHQLIDHARLLLRNGDVDAADRFLDEGVALIDGAPLDERPLHHRGVLMAIADMHYQRRRFDEALALYQTCHEIYCRIYGADHDKAAVGLHTMANCYAAMGRDADAVALEEEAIAIFEKAGMGGSGLMADSLTTLGVALAALERYDDSERQLQRACEIGFALYGEDSDDVLNEVVYLGRTVKAAKGAAQALTIFERAVEVRAGKAPRESGDWVMTLGLYAQCLSSAGRKAESIAPLTEARRLVRKLDGASSANYLILTADQVQILKALGRNEETIALADELLGLCRLHRAPDPGIVPRTLFAKGQALVNLSRWEDAMAALQASHDAFREANGPDDPRLAEIRRGLRTIAEKIGR